jgi:hypothetical protein
MRSGISKLGWSRLDKGEEGRCLSTAQVVGPDEGKWGFVKVTGDTVKHHGLLRCIRGGVLVQLPQAEGNAEGSRTAWSPQRERVLSADIYQSVGARLGNVEPSLLFCIWKTAFPNLCGKRGVRFGREKDTMRRDLMEEAGLSGKWKAVVES